MMKRDLVLATFFLLLFIGISGPARADIPTFAAYFAGTWTCVTHQGSHVVKAFGAAGNGKTMILVNTFTTSNGYTGEFYDRYTQDGSTANVVEQVLTAPGFVFLASSPGFQDNKLVFSGTETGPQGTEFERMTYTRTDENHFTRTFESGASSSGPLTTSSVEDCVRVSSAPIPTPAP